MTNQARQRINATAGEDDKPGERGHTPSRGAPCQYLAGEGLRLACASLRGKLSCIHRRVPHALHATDEFDGSSVRKDTKPENTRANYLAILDAVLFIACIYAL